MAKHTLVTPYQSPLLTNKFSQVYLMGGITSISTFQADVITQMAGVTSLFKDAGDYIGSVRWYPFSLQGVMNLTTSSLLPANTTSISLGGVTLNNAKGFKIFDPSSYTGGILPDNPNNSFKVLIGRIQVARTFGDFLDYSQTLKLWIPYFGYVDLDPKEVVGWWVYVYFNLDIYSGKMCCYVLKDTTGTISTDAIILQTMESVIGVDIPITLTNNGMWAMQQAITSIQGVMNPKGALSTAGSLLSNKQHTDYHPQSTTLINRMLLPQECFIEYHRANKVSTYGSSDYNALYGLPSDALTTLDSFEGHGYVKVAECHLEGEQFATATSKEIESIDLLLKEGVLL